MKGFAIWSLRSWKNYVSEKWNINALVAICRWFLMVYGQCGSLNWRHAWEGFCCTSNFLQQRMYKLWRWNFIYIDSTLYRFLLIERKEYVKAISLIVWTNRLIPFFAYYYIMSPLNVHEIEQQQMYWVAVLSQNGSLALILPWSWFCLSGILDVENNRLIDYIWKLALKRNAENARSVC